LRCEVALVNSLDVFCGQFLPKSTQIEIYPQYGNFASGFSLHMPYLPTLSLIFASLYGAVLSEE
jgi:hypothetical protein